MRKLNHKRHCEEYRAQYTGSRLREARRRSNLLDTRSLLRSLRSLAMTGLLLFMSTIAYAEVATIEQLPKLPDDTVLFDNEKMFGRRGKLGGFALKPSKYGIYYDDKEAGAIKIIYSKVDEKSFCGAYIILLADMSRYSTLTFMIKGKSGGEAFEIGLNDTISNKREDAVMIGSIYRYLPEGITTDWQKVVVPLQDFFGSNMFKVYSLVFHFNEMGYGAFWINDIQFHTEHMFNIDDQIYQKGYLLLDDFDHNDLNLLGRKTNTYKKLPSLCESMFVENERIGNKGKSLKLNYDKE